MGAVKLKDHFPSKKPQGQKYTQQQANEDKKVIEATLERLKKKLHDPKEVKKAALIISQMLDTPQKKQK